MFSLSKEKKIRDHDLRAKTEQVTSEATVEEASLVAWVKQLVFVLCML